MYDVRSLNSLHNLQRIFYGEMENINVVTAWNVLVMTTDKSLKQVMVFRLWLMLYSDVAEYQCFRGTWCLHLTRWRQKGAPKCWYLTPHHNLKMETARSLKILVSYHIATWHHNQQDHNLNLHYHENLISRKLVELLYMLYLYSNILFSCTNPDYVTGLTFFAAVCIKCHIVS